MTYDLAREQREEDIQEYGSLLSKQGKSLLSKGLFLRQLTSEQATVLVEHCTGLIELGTLLLQRDDSAR